METTDFRNNVPGNSGPRAPATENGHATDGLEKPTEQDITADSESSAYSHDEVDAEDEEASLTL